MSEWSARIAAVGSGVRVFEMDYDVPLDVNISECDREMTGLDECVMMFTMPQ